MVATTLRTRGMSVLVKELGNVEAEHFIALINSDNIDYTQWRKTMLDDGKSVRELSREASAYFARSRRGERVK